MNIDMSIDTLVDFILIMDSNEDLNRIIDAVEGARQRQAIMARMRFRIGDTVSFRARGSHWTGKIQKICQKNIKVRVWDDMRAKAVQWTISPTLLTKES